MLRLLADENFNNDIVRGMFRRCPELDLVRLQDVGLSNAPDRQILEWAARERRVLLTHDVSTMTREAFDRVQRGQSMPGIIEVDQKVGIGLAIEDMLLIVECALPEELEAQVLYLPL